MEPSGPNGASPLLAVEKAVSLVLRIGVISSATIIGAGLALLAVKGTVAGAMRLDAVIPYPRNLDALLTGLFALDPASVIMLGLIVLVATPIVRVAISMAAFAVERDWRYVAVTSIVLTILIAGIALGKAVD